MPFAHHVGVVAQAEEDIEDEIYRRDILENLFSESDSSLCFSVRPVG